MQKFAPNVSGSARISLSVCLCVCVFVCVQRKFPSTDPLDSSQSCCSIHWFPLFGCTVDPFYVLSTYVQCVPSTYNTFSTLGASNYVGLGFMTRMGDGWWKGPEIPMVSHPFKLTKP